MTRRRRRVLRGAMWVCVALAWLIAALWVASGWFDFEWARYTQPSFARLEIGQGSFLLAGGSDQRNATFDAHVLGLRRIRPGEPASRWDVHAEDGFVAVRVPIWFLGLLALAPAVLFYRLSRRPRPGMCTHCHYDLSGVPAGSPRPECGHDWDVRR